MNGKENDLTTGSPTSDPARFIRKADTIDARPINRIAAQMDAPDPIFEKEGKFFFWDETWTGQHGPFDTREDALAGMRKYAESLG